MGTDADPGQEQEVFTIDELLKQAPFCSTESSAKCTKLRIQWARKIVTGEDELHDGPINSVNLEQIGFTYLRMEPRSNNPELTGTLTQREIRDKLASAGLWNYLGQLPNAISTLRRNSKISPALAMPDSNSGKPIYYYSPQDILSIIDDIADERIPMQTDQEEKYKALALFEQTNETEASA